MSEAASIGAKTLVLAEWIADRVQEQGGHCAVIGAVALAAHGYARTTRDLDLATELDPVTQMRDIEAICRQEGMHAVLRLPDAEDPRGGVLTVHGQASHPVQLVNFHNPLRATRNPGADAIATSCALIAGSPLRIAGVAQLVALKLYAGGFKSKLDVLELLRCQPAIDRGALEACCTPYGLQDELAEILAELP